MIRPAPIWPKEVLEWGERIHRDATDDDMRYRGATPVAALEAANLLYRLYHCNHPHSIDQIIHQIPRITGFKP